VRERTAMTRPPSPRASPTRLAAAALVLVLVPGGPTSHAAERVDARVTVDPTAVVRVVDGRYFGLNATIWDEAFAKPETPALLADAGTRVLRFPGGSLSDEYHWKTNTTLGNTWTWATDFDAFARVAVALNSAVYITVNYGSGTPEEAAEWVTYANVTRRYGFKFWEIGNENYGLWETDLQVVRHDPYTYALRTRDYVAQMKAADPTIRVGVVVITGEDSYVNNLRHPATNPRTGRVHNGWTPVLLATLRSLGVTPDFAVYHRYEQAPGAESDAALLQSARTWADDARDLRQQLTDYLGPAGAGVELVVTENNSVYSDPGKQTTSLVNGLFLADSVGNILQTEFRALLWWDVRNGQLNANNNGDALYGWRPYGDYGVISTASTFGSPTSFEPYPTYYVAKLLSHWARGGDLVVRAQSDHALLPVFAARTNTGDLKLLVINKSPTAALTARIDLGTFDSHRTAKVCSYGIPQDEAARTGIGSGDLATAALEIPGPTFSATFAPYSVTVLSLQPRDPQRIVRRVLRRFDSP
jgi:alpha-N-arabinofuranosidase